SSFSCSSSFVYWSQSSCNGVAIEVLSNFWPNGSIPKSYSSCNFWRRTCIWSFISSDITFSPLYFLLYFYFFFGFNLYLEHLKDIYYLLFCSNLLQNF